MRAVDASPSLRSKRDLIEHFVDSVSVNGAGEEQWQAFVAAKREAHSRPCSPSTIYGQNWLGTF